jgi:hypothetical protein
MRRNLQSPAELAGFSLLSVLYIGSLCFGTGCREADGISSYTVPKPPTSSSAASEPDRMLAAIIPNGPKSWFFKLTGPESSVAELADPFASFIGTVRFSEGQGDDPTWTLPDGWRKREGDSVRFATIEIMSNGQTVELTVTALPTPGGDIAEYVLSNINRWRGQLQLSPFGANELAQNTSTLDVGGATATLVDLTGQLASDNMSRPPFAPFASGAASTGATGPSNELADIQAPDGWTPGQLVVSRGGITVQYAAAFDVRDGDQQAEITVSSFPAAMASPIQNVNRWRAQIGLGSLSESEINQQLEAVAIGDVDGSYLEIVGPEDVARRERILVAFAVRRGTAWFFKLKGDAELAQREKDNFVTFVASAKFKN